MRLTLSCTLAALLLSPALVAGTVAISSYNITDAAMNGHGGWSHTYNGTITPGFAFTHQGYTGTQANYSGGSGTLNDGVIGVGYYETQLLVQGLTSSGNTLSPVITLQLAGTFVIDSIKIYGAPEFGNVIPGCFTGVTVGLGGSSAALPSTEFGGGNCGGLHDLITINGTTLAGLATSTITLSNFAGPLFGGVWIGITEIVVEGTAASGVPEPATYLSVACGLAALALRRRRRAGAVESAR